MAPRKQKVVVEEEAPVVLVEEGDNGVVSKVTVTLMPIRKRVSFFAWADIAGIPSAHRAGMQAFVSHPELNRTIETWYSLFDGY